MGKKKNRKDDDDDYFASLAASQAPVEVDEAEEERRFAQAEAARQRAAEKKVKDDAEKQERAESAARAKAAMERRRMKKTQEDEEEEEEEEQEEEEPEDQEEEEAQEKEEAPVALSALGTVLLGLRRLDSGVLAFLVRLVVMILTTFASADTLAQLEPTKIKKETNRIYCTATKRWYPKDKVELPVTVRISGDKYERCPKNVKTKGKTTWTRFRIGEGFASAPESLDVPSATIPESKIRFLVLLEDGLFDVTKWISTIVTLAAVKDLDMVDALRPLFFVDGDVATLNPKVEADAEQKFSATKPKKEKISRADKKAKKLQYRR